MLRHVWMCVLLCATDAWAQQNQDVGNRSVTISPSVRDRAIGDLPEISQFAKRPSDRFLVDMERVSTGHPYKGRRAVKPHTGGHVYFTPRARAPVDSLTEPSAEVVSTFPAIYAVADGVISRIDYSFRLREMYEPALGRRVANRRYGIGLMFARTQESPVVFHYSIEPFVDPRLKDFYDAFLLVKPGQRVRKGDVIARMYLPPNRELAQKSHIHFNLIGGPDHRFMAPTIFVPSIAARFHQRWGRFGTDGGSAIPACMGYLLSADENPFGSGRKSAL